MFVAFADIEEPNALTAIEARQLHAELLMGTPSVTDRQVAKEDPASDEHASVARGGRVLSAEQVAPNLGAPTRLAWARVLSPDACSEPRRGRGCDPCYQPCYQTEQTSANRAELIWLEQA